MGNGINTVGIFIYEFPITQQITDICISFINKNIKVHLFICNIKQSSVSNIKLLNHPKIKVHLIACRNLLYKIYSIPYMQSVARHIYRPPVIHKKAIEALNKSLENLYLDISIGIEKQGFIWLCESMIKDKTSIFYYSLELYLEDYKNELSKFYFYRGVEVRKKEASSLKKASAVIIQDKSRATIFKSFNQNYSKDFLYFPVSSSKHIVSKKTEYFRTKFSIDITDKIILNFGFLNRVEEKVITTINSINKSHFKFIFHGQGSLQFHIEKKQSSSVFFSTEILPESEFESLIKECYIGLAIYPQSNFNNRLITFSSNKIALYLKYKKPFIAFKNEEFERLKNEFNCFALIEKIEDIPFAIEEIENNYTLMAENCAKAFKHYFTLENNFDKLFSSLQKYID